ncbi:unnamed protein product [Rotaria magnacalcarata]|uniref:F-box domain-containing protein n=1 Tax=Rotaria magnacalcarata TaxID=392030 RepID=A0A815BJM2_9BILA|nr:unnamed protein product [Rotaria magnacalcarata]
MDTAIYISILRLDTQTHLEDLSNEIFFEIFDYLHALDIFSAFASLNERISSILRSIPLRILISKNPCRNQIDFLSSHFTFHTRQAISIKIRDTIRDDASIVSLLFSRHDFINLQFCRLTTIDRSTKLDNVIKQIKTFNILVSFNISNLNDETMNVDDKCELTRTMLMHQSSSLRLIVLQYTYDYSNVTSLHLYIDGSPSIVSVLSVIAILRLCHRVRYLHIMLKDNSPVDDTNIYVPIAIPTVNKNDLSVLSQVISFGLTLFAAWNNDSVARILRCIPNLKYFLFTLGPYRSQKLFSVELLDGYVWQEMLELYVSYLSKLEFHMSVRKCFRQPIWISFLSLRKFRWEIFQLAYGY